MEQNETPRVLARLTSEELDHVNGGARCPNYPTTDLDGRGDVGGYTINLGTGRCD